MDLIDRQIAIADFEWCKSQANDKDKWQEAIDRIKALPAADTDISAYSDKLWHIAYERGKAEAQRWIPVSKKLPDDGRTVLVTDWGETDFGRRHDGRWWNCDGDVLKDVSAWMPLPEPYKEGEQDG